MSQETARQASGAYGSAPWFQRALRWSFVDPRRASARQTPEWWRAYWQRLSVQGVVIPTTYAGDAASAADLAATARREGNVVVMSHEIGLLDRATATAHPDWVARQNNQNPFGEAARPRTLRAQHGSGDCMSRCGFLRSPAPLANRLQTPPPAAPGLFASRLPP